MQDAELSLAALLGRTRQNLNNLHYSRCEIAGPVHCQSPPDLNYPKATSMPEAENWSGVLQTIIRLRTPDVPGPCKWDWPLLPKATTSHYLRAELPLPVYAQLVYHRFSHSVFNSLQLGELSVLVTTSNFSFQVALSSLHN